MLSKLRSATSSLKGRGFSRQKSACSSALKNCFMVDLLYYERQHINGLCRIRFVLPLPVPGSRIELICLYFELIRMKASMPVRIGILISRRRSEMGYIDFDYSVKLFLTPSRRSLKQSTTSQPFEKMTSLSVIPISAKLSLIACQLTNQSSTTTIFPVSFLYFSSPEAFRLFRKSSKCLHSVCCS